MGEIGKPSKAVRAALRKLDRSPERQEKLKKLCKTLPGFRYDAKNKRVVAEPGKEEE